MAEMTIKEKARVAWEKGFEVVVTDAACDVMRGRVKSYAPDLVIAPNYGRQSLEYRTLKDIRLVDEPEKAQEEISLQVQVDSQKVLLDAALDENIDLRRKNAELKESLCEPVAAEDEKCTENTCTKFNCVHRGYCSQPESKDCYQNDVASERWAREAVSVDGQYEDRIMHPDGRVRYLVENLGSATDAQMEVMSHAPELADMMRQLVRHGWDDEGEIQLMTDCIKLLRKLGVPNVAPWYKGDEDPDMSIFQKDLSGIEYQTKPT